MKRTIFILLSILLPVLVLGCSDSIVEIKGNSDGDTNLPSDELYKISPIDGYVWVWGDEFEKEEVDETKWSYRDWESWIGSTMCRSENVSQKDGYMRIKLAVEDYTDPISGKSYEATAGGLISKNRFKFGYYEVSAKLSPVKGWHESFWGHWSCSNEPSKHFEGWQTAPRTEIDCFEHTAEYDNKTYTYGMYEITDVWPNESMSSVHRDMHFGEVDLTASFNTYGFEYTADYINYFFNGKIIKTVDIRNVGHQYFHLWLTTIATRTPDGDGEVLWDYLRCYEADENSVAYKERREHFLQVLNDMQGETSSEGTDIWVEAEDFIKKGGWSALRDDNTMVLGGNSKIPDNEEDRFARTIINVEKAGNYQLWVRSKDFKDNLPGKRHFQIRVNGAIFNGFGKHGSENLYDWENGGAVYLEKGRNEIVLYDSSCYYAKCDKILFTTDSNFKPTGMGGESNVEHLPFDEGEIYSLWIEAEDFTNPGGWTVGTDAGNGVLTGQSKKPTDESLLIAKTRIVVPEAGTYYLWVRSKDVYNDQPGRRTFEVKINGVAANKLFGTHGSQELYDWQAGGTFKLTAGESIIEMLDTSLFWARCDKFLLTTSSTFIPSDKGEASNVEHK